MKMLIARIYTAALLMTAFYGRSQELENQLLEPYDQLFIQAGAGVFIDGALNATYNSLGYLSGGYRFTLAEGLCVSPMISLRRSFGNPNFRLTGFGAGIKFSFSPKKGNSPLEFGLCFEESYLVEQYAFNFMNSEINDSWSSTVFSISPELWYRIDSFGIGPSLEVTPSRQTLLKVNIKYDFNL